MPRGRKITGHEPGSSPSTMTESAAFNDTHSNNAAASLKPLWGGHSGRAGLKAPLLPAERIPDSCAKITKPAAVRIALCDRVPAAHRVEHEIQRRRQRRKTESHAWPLLDSVRPVQLARVADDVGVPIQLQMRGRE